MNIHTLAKQNPSIFATPCAYDEFDRYRKSYAQYCEENEMECDEEYDPELDGPAPVVDEIKFSVWLDAKQYETCLELVKSHVAGYNERYKAAEWLLSETTGPCTIHSYAAKLGVSIDQIVADLFADRAFLAGLNRLKAERRAQKARRAQRALQTKRTTKTH